ncbi:hypothetical protein CRG98_037792 [Punica granatum]|uniref:MSP domain-containing protein n=1 Tax=Punica granatum TaxID=22663 RepID=A0A2I0ICV9_PUNGR|nr:hypothetical protein CRG98_037792 [Punica granatum]
MTTELLDIQPRELKFTFELKKQSSCSIILSNKTEQHVAFKVKTTSPKKYCVRPNSGVIKPKSSCDFTVTMQAQRVAPPEMKCKDKFLVQSTIVPFGTSEEEITSDLFAKGSGKYVEERKIRVSLVSPVESAVLLPINGGQKQDPCPEASLLSDRVPSGIENIPPPHTVSEDMEGLDAGKASVGHQEETNETEPTTFWHEDELKIYQNIQYPNSAEDLEGLKSKLRVMDSKLREEMLRKSRPKKAQVGFPLLYVCTVALISMVVGYLAHT